MRMTLALKPMGRITEIQNSGNQWPNKMDLGPTKNFKKIHSCFKSTYFCARSASLLLTVSVSCCLSCSMLVLKCCFCSSDIRIASLILCRNVSFSSLAIFSCFSAKDLNGLKAYILNLNILNIGVPFSRRTAFRLGIES